MNRGLSVDLDTTHSSIAINSVIAGRYQVFKCLGSGGMGLVYACYDLERSRRAVAVKVLSSELLNDSVAFARFVNEVRTAQRIHHPNVIQVYESIADRETVAYSMEYLEGEDLAERLSRLKKLPLSEAIGILAQICAGVQSIHAAQIVHRDLKPENIMLTKNGLVKITDFGIAKREGGQRLTDHGGIVGSLNYVCPEYLLESKLDPRADLYAIGVLGYEMLVGDSPFQSESIIKAIEQRIHCDAPRPSLRRKDCPLALDQIILKALARNPDERYSSAGSLLRDLKVVFPHYTQTTIEITNDHRILTDMNASSLNPYNTSDSAFDQKKPSSKQSSKAEADDNQSAKLGSLQIEISSEYSNVSRSKLPSFERREASTLEALDHFDSKRARTDVSSLFFDCLCVLGAVTVGILVGYLFLTYAVNLN